MRIRILTDHYVGGGLAHYLPHLQAQEAANGRRRRSRKHSQFTDQDWQLVEELLRSDLSPEQVSGWLARSFR